MSVNTWLFKISSNKISNILFFSTYIILHCIHRINPGKSTGLKSCTRNYYVLAVPVAHARLSTRRPIALAPCGGIIMIVSDWSEIVKRLDSWMLQGRKYSLLSDHCLSGISPTSTIRSCDIFLIIKNIFKNY